MPGPALTQHLAACNEDAFNEVVRIFRHDFNLYAGMLQSWTSLFEVEALHYPQYPDFVAATHTIQERTGQFFDHMQARLYPQYLPPRAPSHAHICAWWDRYYEDFAAYARPRLRHLEAQLHAYTRHPQFEIVIQVNLGAAVNHERIDKLMLNAYTKLLALLDAEHFDARAAAVLPLSKSARTG
jgi:hypothetical protein